MSVSQFSSVQFRRRRCLLGKHWARPGQGWPPSMLDLSLIRVRGQDRSSGGDLTSDLRPDKPNHPRVTTSLSPLVSPQCWQWQLQGLTRTTYTTQWSLWVICCLQKYFSAREQLTQYSSDLSLSWSHNTAQYH